MLSLLVAGHGSTLSAEFPIGAAMASGPRVHRCNHHDIITSMLAVAALRLLHFSDASASFAVAASLQHTLDVAFCEGLATRSATPPAHSL